MDWHRLFGLALRDFFLGSPFEVEIEVDLSLKKQLLDVVILRKLAGEFAGRLPDGFDELATFNLITFKSHQQSLDAWAMLELIAHFVNYRKQASPSPADLHGEEDFRLYAVCARFPQGLASEVQLDEMQPGVYDCRWGTKMIRIIVTSRLAEEDHNAILHLFSAQQERIRFGAAHYRQRSSDTSTLITSLFEHYQLEGFPMPYTMEEFKREFLREHLDEVPHEELLKRLSPEERLMGLPPEELLKALSTDDLARVLSREQIEAILEKRRQEEESN